MAGLVTLAALIGFAPAVAAAAPDANRDDQVRPRSSAGGNSTGNWGADGYDDVLVRQANTGQLKVFPNVGAIGPELYGDPVTINNGWGSYRWIGQADFNGDGFADLGAIDQAGLLKLSYNNASGVLDLNLLGPIQTVDNRFGDYDLVFTGDWNGDGKDDMLARQKNTNNTFFFLNDGTGHFGPRQFAFDTAPGVRNEVAADVTGDGKLDVLVVRDSGELVLLDFRNGEPPERYSVRRGLEIMNSVGVTDADNDGDPDLYARRTASGELGIQRHNGSWDPANPGATFGPRVAIRGGWHAFNAIS